MCYHKDQTQHLKALNKVAQTGYSVKTDIKKYQEPYIWLVREMEVQKIDLCHLIFFIFLFNLWILKIDVKGVTASY